MLRIPALVISLQLQIVADRTYPNRQHTLNHHQNCKKSPRFKVLDARSTQPLTSRAACLGLGVDQQGKTMWAGKETELQVLFDVVRCAWTATEHRLISNRCR
uniref:Uncharacterized protein n=1 Tax=Eutreptiella gymnastica TaxID=73025 RepID=A0A7S4C9Z2_9EUGL|mmetsp:Transcript_103073/g.174590  ORF Transcript_103073/g.174590 Transcript_103073/m.174590 type:complete len:102 (-) Transcript_103073:71-376(-)